MQHAQIMQIILLGQLSTRRKSLSDCFLTAAKHRRTMKKCVGLTFLIGCKPEGMGSKSAATGC